MKKTILALSMVLLLSFSIASAQVTKMTVGYGSISSAQLPAWIAKESGIFNKNGLDVQLVFFKGSTTAVMALMSRETPISQVTGPPIVNAGLRGGDSVFVAGGAVIIDYWLMSRPDIKTAEQLKGGSIAVSTFGGQSEFVSRIALKKLGLTPGKDVTMVQIGVPSDRLIATETGKVRASLLNAPDSFIGEKKGLYTHAYVSLPSQSTGVATTRRFIRENPDLVRKYVRAQVEAVHRIKTDKETALRVLVKYLGAQDKQILERTYEDIASDEKLPPRQYPTLEGLKAIIDPLAETDVKAKSVKPEDFVDMSFVRELDQSGFIDSLYKKR
jgi:ABC-type nitrate/sulfonate/bicarbonate transport system substrate-binding protein